MSALDGAQGGGGEGDDIDPATGLPRVNAPITLPRVDQVMNTIGRFVPSIGALSNAVNAYSSVTSPPTVTPGSAADTLLAGTPSENYDRQEPTMPGAAATFHRRSPLRCRRSRRRAVAGGASPGLGLGPTAGQTVARGAVQTADEGEQDVIKRKGSLEAQKADDQVALDIAQKEQERHLQQQVDDRAAQLNADLKAKQDVLAKDKIHDIFDGRPLAAVIAAISSGLGAFAATRTGGVNHAQAILDNAASMFRQKELHRFEQEEKSVEGARGDINHAEARADASMAQLYRTFARDRETVLRKRGADDAAIQADTLIQQNVAKGADRDLKWQDQNATIARQEVNDRAQRAAQYASAGHANAETKKTLAEAAVLQAGGGKEAAGRGITDARQRAFLANGMKAQDKIASEMESQGVKLDENDLATIQKNRTYLEALKHGDKSTMDALGTELSRKIGFLPRSEFDGLDDSKKRLAGALNQMTQKAALLNAGSMTGEAIQHATTGVDLLAPNQGPEEQARRREYIREGIIGANQGLVPGQIAAAAAGSAAALAERAPAAGPKMSQADRVRATEFVRNNRGPKADAVRKLLEAQ
jgi:hypothetical protein